MSGLRHTPLLERHRGLGARIVEFAGFQMPLDYGSILAEHALVRKSAGLFDVSHMGQIHLSGPAAAAEVERLVSCKVADLAPGQVRYGLLCNEEGGVVDDVTVYRLASDAFFLCVNAANLEKDWRWIAGHAAAQAGARDRSTETALLALQGPAAAKLLAPLADADVTGLRRFRFLRCRVAGAQGLVSRTGYTGSDGFEIYLEADDAGRVWDALLSACHAAGAGPAGLGARDLLRLEAALPLYGHELDDTTSPLEARLDRFVKLDAGGFIGAEAIARRRAAGHRRLLTGFVLEQPGIARAGHPIALDGAELGVVTSGGPSPSLGKSIGLGYVPPALADPDACFDVVIRGRPVRARAVETPFFRDPSPRRTRPQA